MERKRIAEKIAQWADRRTATLAKIEKTGGHQAFIRQQLAKVERANTQGS